MGDVPMTLIATAQIAERDAEIAQLRAQVAELTGKLAYNRNYAAAAFAQQRELIDALRAQVAELEAWKAAVPVKELNRLMTVSPFDSVEADIVWKWLKFSRHRHNR